MLDSTTEQQQTGLSTRAEPDFVTAARNSIVIANPRLGDDPTLLDRLAKAYGEARRMGLMHHELLAEFLRLEADVPSFYRQSAISKWLKRPGASIDDRFKDLLDVLRKKLELAHEDL